MLRNQLAVHIVALRSSKSYAVVPSCNNISRMVRLHMRGIVTPTCCQAAQTQP
jgi:hypothetical protein